MDKMLNPGIVCVVHRRDTVFPAGVFPQPFTAPVTHIEGRVSKDEISTKVFVQIVMETVRVLPAKVSIEPSDSQVHHGQPPGCGVGFLTVDCDVAQPTAAFLNKTLALDEHSARTTAGVVHPALMWLNHPDE